MSYIDFDDVKVFDDEVSNLDIMKSIIKAEDKEDAFFVFDIAEIIRKHKDWIEKMPRVIPHYAIKCNSDPMVIKILATLNACFDCASEQEIKEVMLHNVSSERIIFANPAKSPSHIKYAKKVNVRKMTVDSEIELLKIKEIFPEAKIVIRTSCDLGYTPFTPGSKFGCDVNEANRLIRLTKELGLILYGFSFHVGSPCENLHSYSAAIKSCKELIATAKSMKCTDIKLLDIGGGFPGESGTGIAEIANIINTAIEDIDPTINIISEPGRYYVTSAFSLAAHLYSKRIVMKGDQITRMYYVNCGTYGAFIEELLHLRARHPMPLFNPVKDEKFVSVMWGPTCDAYDCILENALLPELHVGDWMVWTDMGAYTLSLATTFNGILPPLVYPIIRKSEWETFCREANIPL